MKIHIRPAEKAERRFAYTLSEDDSFCGCVGHLRADFGSSGREFWSSWADHNRELKTDEFRQTLDDVINRLRENEVFHPLKSRTKMARFCADYPESAEGGGYAGNHIFRADAGSYSFIMRMNPNPGFYNLYCYCYQTDKLNAALAADMGEEE